MEETSTTDAASNIDNGDRDAVAVLVHNIAKVQVLLPPLCLPAVMPYMGAPPSTISSTVPVAKWCIQCVQHVIRVGEFLDIGARV